jgi:hypothetical protein
MKTELYGAIIAAAAALLGVIVSQVFSILHKSAERRYERQTLLRQKFEEMSMHISSSLNWLATMHNSTSWQELVVHSQSKDARRAVTLCQLYFPELTEPVNRYIRAQISCYQHAVESYSNAGKTGNVGAIAMMSSGYKDKINALFSTKNELETLITMSAGLYSQ